MSEKTPLVEVETLENVEIDALLQKFMDGVHEEMAHGGREAWLSGLDGVSSILGFLIAVGVVNGFLYKDSGIEQVTEKLAHSVDTYVREWTRGAS
jgi:hypothetical protein